MDPNQPQQPDDNTSPVTDPPTSPSPVEPWTPAVDGPQAMPGPVTQPVVMPSPEPTQPLGQPPVATPPFPSSPEAGPPAVVPPTTSTPPMPMAPQQPAPLESPMNPVTQAGFPAPPPPANFSEPAPASSRTKIIFATVLVIVLAGLGYGVYYLVTHTHSSNKDATNQAVSQSRNSNGAKSLTNMNNVSMQEPTANKLGGLTFVAGSNNENSLINSGATCSIVYGTPSQKVLPGGNIGDVIAKISNTLENQGITVGKPITTDALILSSSTTSQKYSLPTVTFKYSKGSTNLVAIYSIAELADQSHAVVLQACYGTDSFDALSQNVAQQLTPVAEAITIKTQ